MYYSIDDADGTRICSGIQLEHKARETAQRYANDLGEPVLLYSDAPDDEGVLVHPEPASDDERALIKATIEERGNGFPGVGEYVTGDDGELYRIVRMGSRIETQAAGRGNCIPDCELEPADWDDVTDENEPYASATMADDEGQF